MWPHRSFSQCIKTSVLAGGCLPQVDIGYVQLSDKNIICLKTGNVGISVAVVTGNLCSFPGFCIFGFSRYNADDRDDHSGFNDDYDDYATKTPFLND